MSSDISTAGPRREPPTGTVQAELGGFAARMFEQCGGIVEWADAGQSGTALVPEKIAQLLGVEESVPLTPQHEPGAICISLASEFLDQAETVLQTLVPRVGACCIPDAYLKGGDLQAAVDRRYTWHNARVRVRESQPLQIAYHHWWFFASLQSDDVWESRMNISINAASQVPVPLPNLLTLPELEPGLELPPVAPVETFDAAVHAVQEQLLNDAANFVGRMESRLQRDRKRLREYYGALKREASSTRQRHTAPVSDEEIDRRKRAVNLELQRKLGELDERYQMDATIEPIALVSLQATVLVVELAVQRKRAERRHRLYWNPLVKQFEPLRCTRCGQGTFSAAFTDDEVAAVCAGCHACPETRRPKSNDRPVQRS